MTLSPKPNISSKSESGFTTTREVTIADCLTHKQAADYVDNGSTPLTNPAFLHDVEARSPGYHESAGTPVYEDLAGRKLNSIELSVTGSLSLVDAYLYHRALYVPRAGVAVEGPSPVLYGKWNKTPTSKGAGVGSASKSTVKPPPETSFPLVEYTKLGPPSFRDFRVRALQFFIAAEKYVSSQAEPLSDSLPVATVHVRADWTLARNGQGTPYTDPQVFLHAPTAPAGAPTGIYHAIKSKPTADLNPSNPGSGVTAYPLMFAASGFSPQPRAGVLYRPENPIPYFDGTSVATTNYARREGDNVYFYSSETESTPITVSDKQARAIHISPNFKLVPVEPVVAGQTYGSIQKALFRPRRVVPPTGTNNSNQKK